MINKIITLYKIKKINKTELILLLFFINGDNNLKVILNYFELEEIKDIKINIQSLYQKKIIILKQDEVLLNTLFFEHDENFQELKVSKNMNLNKLSIEDIDAIKVLINREIKSFEIDFLRVWIETYSIEDIKNAFYKASLKNIDNFNYVLKILQNNTFQDKKNKGENKIIRKFDFFNK